VFDLVIPYIDLTSSIVKVHFITKLHIARFTHEIAISIAIDFNDSSVFSSLQATVSYMVSLSLGFAVKILKDEHFSNKEEC
jgi:hypothetical protein